MSDKSAKNPATRNPEYYEKNEELKAMAIAVDAVIRLAQRHAEKARELADAEENPDQRAELLKIADICSHVPASERQLKSVPLPTSRRPQFSKGTNTS